MSIQEIAKNTLLHLPYTQSGQSFKMSIEELLNKYLQLVDTLDDGPIDSPALSHIDGWFVKDAQRKFVPGLLEVIDLYHSGRPAEAFKRFDRVMMDDLKDYSKILAIHDYPIDQSFYRMRIKKGNFPLARKEMFHIPFELRGIVATQRYSIPGFPCLYLGSTLYGCWEELRRPDFHEFHASRLVNKKRVKFIDLTSPIPEGPFARFTKIDEATLRRIYYYFMTWPLIACCSVKVKDYNNAFRSEYIIPQILLQWVRETHSVDAIKFNSTHIDTHKSKSLGDFSNLVLPVKQNRETGFCPDLQSMFEMTNAVSWQLYQSAAGGQVFERTFQGSGFAGEKIGNLELIEGMVFPYRYSILGELEQFLTGMRALPIEPINPAGPAPTSPAP